MELAKIDSLSVMETHELREVNGGFIFGPSVALFSVSMMKNINEMYADFKQGLNDGYNKRMHQ